MGIGALPGKNNGAKFHHRYWQFWPKLAFFANHGKIGQILILKIDKEFQYWQVLPIFIIILENLQKMFMLAQFDNF